MDTNYSASIHTNKTTDIGDFVSNFVPDQNRRNSGQDIDCRPINEQSTAHYRAVRRFIHAGKTVMPVGRVDQYKNQYKKLEACGNTRFVPIKRIG